MPSRLGPEHAPAGDVGTALAMVEARLRRFRGGAPHEDGDFEPVDGAAAEDVLDGACTLVHLYMRWLRQAHERHGQDVLATVVPYVVGTLAMMPRSIGPAAVPTMAAMLTAAACDLSPTLWRAQYGPWMREETAALEVTVFLLAEHIDRLTGDPAAATRLVGELLDGIAAERERG
ncbi:hypothetical protein [Actinomadura parmotrematis]|uniref:Uncharacterized protein n=1 Tax=Actinomadura parmotrematis TaxID=2864039 RepID=A0ABS7G1N6_9ACTN|nr:hypothetical protein [Actinomadura parmotrematis]MBW8486416.1 hypothetical protein [Actinomadura parmotrematis]